MSTAPGLLPSLYFTAYETARKIYHAPRRAAFQSQLAGISADGSMESIRLNYGHITTPSTSDGIIIGGNVKLLHLRERFNEHLSHFNLVYLVSSAPTPYWEELVRWAKQKGCKLVWNQNGVAYRSWCGDYYPWFNAPLKRLLLQADYVVYQSAFCQLCADRYLAPVQVPSEILFNPVDLDHFSPSENPPSTETWQLLAAGTSHHFYRVKSAIDCLARLLKNGSPARLSIAGEFRWRDGDREVADYLQQTKMDSHVRILPPFTQEQAPAIYQSAHVLIHSKYKDPCPTVPIEAMACGVPVVASKSGGMPELVPTNVGMLVDVEEDWDADIAPDSDKLADAVQTIFANHATYSSAARAHAIAAFDKQHWLDAHSAIFKKVMAS
ncbi:MAG: glycosyltransferase family 4 protein [Chthoniobacterales bacterium]